MPTGLNERELLLLFALAWIVGVAVWILLDYLGSNWPKRRFRPRGHHVPVRPRERRRVARAVRRLRDEEVRDTLESATGSGTLSRSSDKQERVATRRRPRWWPGGDDQAAR